MVYVFLVAAIGLFIVGIRVTGIVPRVRSVLAVSHTAVSVIKSTDMHDDEKEAAIQKAAISMIGAFVSILVRVTVICLVPVAFVMLFAWLGLYSIEEAIRASTNVYFVTASTVAMIVALVLMR